MRYIQRIIRYRAHKLFRRPSWKMATYGLVQKKIWEDLPRHISHVYGGVYGSIFLDWKHCVIAQHFIMSLHSCLILLSLLLDRSFNTVQLFVLWFNKFCFISKSLHYYLILVVALVTTLPFISGHHSTFIMPKFSCRLDVCHTGGAWALVVYTACLSRRRAWALVFNAASLSRKRAWALVFNAAACHAGGAWALVVNTSRLSHRRGVGSVVRTTRLSRLLLLH